MSDECFSVRGNFRAKTSEFEAPNGFYQTSVLSFGILKRIIYRLFFTIVF